MAQKKLTSILKEEGLAPKVAGKIPRHFQSEEAFRDELSRQYERLEGFRELLVDAEDADDSENYDDIRTWDRWWWSFRKIERALEMLDEAVGGWQHHWPGASPLGARRGPIPLSRLGA